MEGEDRTLLFAATGLRGGREKLMAVWLDKGDDEGNGRGIEREREKQQRVKGRRKR